MEIIAAALLAGCLLNVLLLGIWIAAVEVARYRVRRSARRRLSGPLAYRWHGGLTRLSSDEPRGGRSHSAADVHRRFTPWRGVHGVFPSTSASATLAGLERSGAERLRVVVADDSDLIRRMAALLVQSDDRLLLVGEAASLAEAVMVTIKRQPDILVLEYELPGGVASDIIGVLRECAPDARVVLFSQRTDIHEIGVRIGADRTVVKGAGLAGLQSALQTLVA